MANRGFTSIKGTTSQNTLKTRFENMLSNVNSMLKRDNIYSTWIRLQIGKNKNNCLTFNSSSDDKDKNLIISLNYEKCQAGVANQFTFKVAFDLFNYGQSTKGNVEALDNLIYKALNINSYEEATDIFYCTFQYGYNVTGNTQLVSPLYEGMITEIIPSVDYTNGKTYYTIKGTSFVLNAGFKKTFPAVEEKNGLQVVAETLWKYMGHPSAADSLSWCEGMPTEQEQDVKDGVVAQFLIDVPQDLAKDASDVTLEAISDMTPISYVEYVLSKTYNTKEEGYNNGTYEITDGDFKPYYTYYITDSGGQGVPTIHITYVSAKTTIENKNGIGKINFNFEWFNKTNNIVVGWNPEVNLMSYFLMRSQIDYYNNKITIAKQTIEQNNTDIENLENENQSYGKKITYQIPLQGPTLNGKPLTKTVTTTIGVTQTEQEKINSNNEIKNDKLQEIENLEANIVQFNDALKQLSEMPEMYKATMTLVGIPADIPLNVVLNIKPKIFESMSRTQGQYYILGATDVINTNGLFTTKLNLFRLKN